MQSEAYQRYLAHLGKKQDLWDKHRKNLASSQAEMENLEREHLVAVIEDDEKSVSKIEKKIDEQTRKIERAKRVLDNLNDYQDNGYQETLVFEALDECDENSDLVRDELNDIRAQIQALSEKQWSLIEEFLETREDLKKIFARRERIKTSVPSDESYWMDVFRRTRGGPPRANLENLGLIDLKDVREKFGRKAR